MIGISCGLYHKRIVQNKPKYLRLRREIAVCVYGCWRGNLDIENDIEAPSSGICKEKLEYEIEVKE